MIKTEYATLLALGGHLRFGTLIKDVEDEIKECISYKSIPTVEEKQRVLDKVAKETIAQDYVLLVHRIHSIKKALQEDDPIRAEELACNIFKR